jgi:hypothetical protein
MNAKRGHLDQSPRCRKAYGKGGATTTNSCIAFEQVCLLHDLTRVHSALSERVVMLSALLGRMF